MKWTNYVGSLWSATDFPSAELKAYAQPLMADETRRGLLILSLLCFALLGSTALANLYLQQGEPFTYTYVCLAVLALHTYVSVSCTRGMAVHHMLGITLLVISGVAVALLAIRTGELHPVMYATIALLFMVVPAVPWGLREASWVIGLVYCIFTVPTLSMAERFPTATLWILQFFMLSCALISLVLVVRTVEIRKQDIGVRFALEKARHELEALAHRDPLTGVLNRRALEPAFRQLAEECGRLGIDSWFCALDIDHFKQINDRYGHDYGDRVLNWVVQSLQQVLLPHEALVRTGGDEFVLMLVGADPSDRIRQAVVQLQELAAADPSGARVSFSVGLKRIAPHSGAGLEESYRLSDRALYAAKLARESERIVTHDVSLDRLPNSVRGHDFRWQER